MEGYIDLANARCVHSGCQKHPVFGEAEGTRAIFCREHKGERHVDVRHKKCSYAGGCDILASYGESTEQSTGAPQFCKQHKSPSHVYLHRRRRSTPGSSSPAPSASSAPESPGPCAPSLSPAAPLAEHQGVSFRLDAQAQQPGVYAE
eukprot:CAMPEP_0169436674 /NCGR_PEP_ID=MMETSP1042-20121227/5720_1 /TAXON_ID=464988 /ORGANISM="Hemiselmis andersenii, Strain CCMP1180" /LENGTH=146 /DNA_ID=CAMNT_0009547395 /DNA_START=134 /DNA_END=571 /DNA_ORIENTATION=+